MKIIDPAAKAKKKASYAKWRAANPDKARENTRRWKRENLPWRTELINSIKLLGCERCGFNAHFSALDFHHIDPSTKRFNVTHTLFRNMDLLMEEISKCVVLCANCHRQITYESIRTKNHLPVEDGV